MRGYFARRTNETLEEQSRGYEIKFKDRLFFAVPALASGLYAMSVHQFTDDPKKTLAWGAVYIVGGLIGILSCYDKRKSLEDEV